MGKSVVGILMLLLCGGCLPFKPWSGPGLVKHRDLPRLKTLDGDRVRTMSRPDAIAALNAPTFVPAAEADFMADDEAVIGIVRNGHARAYSLWHLDRHEIVNDVVAREPIAVTW